MDYARYFVFGLARSGQAIAGLLARRGMRVLAFDDHADVAARAAGTAGADRSWELIDVEAADPRSGDAVVVSPGISLDHPFIQVATANGADVIGEVELAYRLFPGRIVAVTGTNGKSTVVTMIGQILHAGGIRCAVAGNIGRPFADVVDSPAPIDVVVLEISSFQLDTIRRFRADVAVLLNVTPDHLDRYNDSIEEYTASKARVLNRSNDATTFVYNDADERCRAIASTFRGVSIPFSSERELEKGVCIRQGRFAASWGGRERALLDVRDFQPVGIHNRENAMAAIAVGLVFGIEEGVISHVLESYQPLPHRMAVVRTLDGVTYINDSKATNVDAALRSLVSIDGPVLLILGGLDKNGDFEKFRHHADRIKLVILIGSAASKIRSALGGCCEVTVAASMDEAVAEAKRRASEGETVLLAPACASFDMFDNYEARGAAFEAAVAAL